MMHCKCRRLEGHGAIVTGAGCSQIGRAIALRLAQEGSEVVLADINGSAAEGAAADIQQATSSKCTGLQVDMSNEEQVAAMVAEAKRSLPQLSIFVNNAAVFVLKSVTEASEADWDKCLGCNVKGYAFGMKHAAKAMMLHKEEGSIINVASISAWIAQPGFVPYSSSKGAVMQMTRCSAVDLAQHNIRVNAVCPGPILTEGTQRHADSQGVSLEAACQDMIGRMVMPRMGQPEEVASCVAFLASSDASFMTGSAMTCDGGYSLE
eukprot:jgi/Astpho2/3817/Aster-x1174